MAKKKRIRKWLAKPFIALGEAIRRRWWPTDQERMAKIIPDWEDISELRNNIGITYAGDLDLKSALQIKRALEIEGVPMPTDMDPYILVRNKDGRHTKIKTTKSLKQEAEYKRCTRKVWGPDEELEIKENHQPSLRHYEDEDDVDTPYPDA